MVNDSHIIETYKRLSSEELVALAQNPFHLRKEIVPLLANELRSRKLDDVAKELEHITGDGEAKAGALQDATISDINKEVAERIQQGESIESIKADFGERGIDAFELLNDAKKEEEVFFDRLTDLKRSGVKNTGLQQQLILEENISEEDSWVIIDRLRTKGRKNIKYGAIWFFAALFILLYTYAEFDKMGYGTYNSALWRFIVWIGPFYKRNCSNQVIKAG